jgi:hypothetical protein
MNEVLGLRLTTSAALKEKRLAALRQGRPGSEPALQEAVQDAQLLGSLNLAGFDFTWEEVKAARRGEPAPAPILGLKRAAQAVAAGAPFAVASLRAWN